MKKILVVVESIDVEDSSGAKANVALIHNLQKAGYQLLVCHYTRKEIQLKNISCKAIKEKRLSWLFLLSRIERYLRIFLKIKLNKPLEKMFGFSFTLFNDRNSIIAALRKNDDFNPDLIITLSQGGRFRPHHALLKMPELHEKWMAYIHDPYPMHLYPSPYAWSEPGYLQKERFMKDISEKSSINAFPSKLLMDWMGEFFVGYKEKGIVIPHQIHSNEILEIKTPPFFDSQKFNILHAGNLLWGRDPEGLIRGFIKFLKYNSEADKDSCLLFLGAQNHYSSILSKYKSLIPQIYVSDDRVPFDEVQALQKWSSVNVILEAKSKISPFLPGKFSHCVKANKPILMLGPIFSESNRLLGKAYIYKAEIDQVDKIAEHLGEFYRNWKDASFPFKLNRPDLEEYLSEKYLEKTLNKKIFKKL